MPIGNVGAKSLLGYVLFLGNQKNTKTNTQISLNIGYYYKFFIYPNSVITALVLFQNKNDVFVKLYNKSKQRFLIIHKATIFKVKKLKSIPKIRVNPQKTRILYEAMLQRLERHKKDFIRENYIILKRSKVI